MNHNRLELIVNDIVQACLNGNINEVNQYVDPEYKNSRQVETELIQPVRRVLSEPDTSYQVSFEEDYPFTRALIMTRSKQPITPVPLNQQVTGIDLIYDDESDRYFVTFK